VRLEPDEAARKVIVKFTDNRFYLDQLSAGYATMIAIAADIMSGIPPDKLPNMEEAQGIVLLDEIGTQLHPRWRMKVVSDLRRAFPKMQFIATTHEPLCLKSLWRSEVVILQRTDDNDIRIEVGETRDPWSMRVDQLLTSPFFGLNSTIDPYVDALFQKYYELLRIETPTPEERDQRNRLKRDLAPHRGLGYTRVDQLVYSILDDFLAKHPRTGARRTPAALPRDVRRRIEEIWLMADVGAEQNP